MRYLAIVSSLNNKIAKYAVFDTQAEADAHVAAHGGFVYDNQAGTSIEYIYVNGSTARPMTQGEIDAIVAAKENAEVEQEAKKYDTNRALKALATASWHAAKATVPAQALTSPTAYRAWLKTLM